MLGRRRRRWANIKPTSAERLVFAVTSIPLSHKIYTFVNSRYSQNNMPKSLYLRCQGVWWFLSLKSCSVLMWMKIKSSKRFRDIRSFTIKNCLIFVSIQLYVSRSYGASIQFIWLLITMSFVTMCSYDFVVQTKLQSDWQHPSRHKTLNQCLFNVGPPSTTLDQR